MTTYLSPAIQHELIELLGKKVKDLIQEEIKTAKYFSILLDSTPDVSHIDQMVFIVRYVKIDSNNEVQIKESFLNFFPLHGKNADKITKSILNELQQNGLDIMMCRGQSYNNASTIAGVRTGVQCRIKDINSKAFLFHVETTHLTLQEFTQWDRQKFLKHFLLLWKGFIPSFMLLLTDGRYWLSMCQMW